MDSERDNNCPHCYARMSQWCSNGYVIFGGWKTVPFSCSTSGMGKHATFPSKACNSRGRIELLNRLRMADRARPRHWLIRCSALDVAMLALALSDDFKRRKFSKYIIEG